MGRAATGRMAFGSSGEVEGSGEVLVALVVVAGRSRSSLVVVLRSCSGLVATGRTVAVKGERERVCKKGT